MLLMMYSLVAVGQMTVAVAPGAPEHSNTAHRDSEVVPLAVVSVWLAPAHVLIAALPTIASSTIEVILLLTVLPHVPLSSPVAGNASFKTAVYSVVMRASNSEFAASWAFVRH